MRCDPTPPCEHAPIVVACAAAIAQRTLTPDELARATVILTRGGTTRQDELLRALDAGGYRMEPQVTAPGEASRRGGIVDVWPSAEELPVRIELLGDAVESIRAFDPATQRSQGLRESVRIGPARELIVEPGGMRHLAEQMQSGGPAMAKQIARSMRDVRRAPARGAAARRRSRPPETGAYDGHSSRPATLLDHLPAGALIVVDEPADVTAVQRERDDQAHDARRELELRGELPHGMPEPQSRPRAAGRHRGAAAAAQPLALGDWRCRSRARRCLGRGTVVRLPFGPAAAYGGRLRVLAEELTPMLRRGQQVVVVSTQSKRLAELLEEHDIFARVAETMGEPELGRGALTVMHGSLPHGWTVGEDGAGLTLLTDAEVFGFSKQRRAPPRRAVTRARSSPT